MDSPSPRDHDMDPEALRRFGHEVVDWIAHYRRHVEELPVLPPVRPGELFETLPEEAPFDGEPMEAILRDFRREIVPRLTQWNHPGFHAYFANTGSGPGILAEALTAALNNNAMVWRTGPASTELELRTCDWLRRMMGLPGDFEGHIEDTASISTLVALLAARHQATGGAVRDRGLRGLPPMRIYGSEHVHSSIDRAALVLGLGTEAVRRIPLDEHYRMDPDALQAAIAEDRDAGRVPMAVVATVGTTVTTAIDPVPAIAEICEAAGIWLHVDAAYGGAMAVSPGHRDVLEGAGRAQSLVVNPHKWLLVPMDCSVFLTRQPAAVREAMSLVPSYLMTPEDGVARNLMDYGPALGRRFRSLKLWFVLRWFGQRGLAAVIDRHVDLAAEFAGWVEAEPAWEVVAPVPMSLVLVRHRPAGLEDETELRAHNERILERVNARGRSFLSHTVLRAADGREVYALRVAVGNLGTERRHLEGVWGELRGVW